MRTKNLALFLVSIAVLLLVVSVTCAQERTSLVALAGTTQKDLVYAKVGEKSLLLDLYLPNNLDKPMPVIIWVHGGGWQSGSKEHTPAAQMTRHGYAVASINYRVSGEAIFPAQIEDVKAAVRWLRANAKAYNLDSEHFGAWGSSAGGHLVALLGTSGGEKKLEGTGGNLDQSSRVQAVCDFCGPTDFMTWMKENPQRGNNQHTPESKLLGGPLAQRQELARQASPVTYIDKTDPPCFIAHGDADPVVPVAQSRLFHERLKAAGVEVTYEEMKGGGHGFDIRPIAPKVLAFFDKHLKK